MTTITESIRKMMLAHLADDKQGFRVAAEEYALEERRRNHPAVAMDVERLLHSDGGRPSINFKSLTHNGHNIMDSPRDVERDLPMLDIRNPDRNMESLLLDEGVRLRIEKIINENTNAHLLQGYGLEPIKKVLFCGTPGCGKTATAEALARSLMIPLAIVRFDAIIASYLGETAANLRRVFDFARTRPVVLFFDEFDAVAKERGDENEHGELKRVVTSLLQMMDSFRGETILIAATNHQSLLDNALWRRFDEVIFF